MILPLLLLPITHALLTPHHPLSTDYINWLNQQQTQWKAGKNFDPKDLDRVKIMASGAWRTPPSNHPIAPQSHDIPSFFDARLTWPRCQSIRQIWDQSHCGSCWAISAVATMSDRICIKSTREILVSAQDLLSCCQCGRGCAGGEIPKAWWYWQNYGIVTGGLYNTTQGCKAYTLPPCEHHVNFTARPHCDDLVLRTPPCRRQCDVIDKDYDSHLTYGSRVRHLNGVAAIQQEIMTNGPVEGALDVFEDFFNYKSGVYRKVAGRYIGGHAVKILGWGDDPAPYWLCANSWNSDWGDGGYFKVVRGENHCGIEDNVFASEPIL